MHKEIEKTADKKSKAMDKSIVQKKENNTGLPDNLKMGMERLSGLDLSDTRVHYNSSKPAQFQAHAYAQGPDIHIASGQEKHLPHELGHVVQQKEGRVKPTMQMKGLVNVNDDVGLEREADVMGAKALAMGGSSEAVQCRGVGGQESRPDPVVANSLTTKNLSTLEICDKRSIQRKQIVGFEYQSTNTSIFMPPAKDEELLENEERDIGILDKFPNDKVVFEHRRLPKDSDGEKFDQDAKKLVNKIKPGRQQQQVESQKLILAEYQVENVTYRKVREDDQRSFYDDPNDYFKVTADQGEMEIVSGKLDLDEGNEFEKALSSIMAFIERLEEGEQVKIKYTSENKKKEKQKPVSGNMIVTALTTGFAGISGTKLKGAGKIKGHPQVTIDVSLQDIPRLFQSLTNKDDWSEKHTSGNDKRVEALNKVANFDVNSGNDQVNGYVIYIASMIVSGIYSHPLEFKKDNFAFLPRQSWTDLYSRMDQPPLDTDDLKIMILATVQNAVPSVQWNKDYRLNKTTDGKLTITQFLEDFLQTDTKELNQLIQEKKLEFRVRRSNTQTGLNTSKKKKVNHSGDRLRSVSNLNPVKKKGISVSKKNTQTYKHEYIDPSKIINDFDISLNQQSYQATGNKYNVSNINQHSSLRNKLNTKPNSSFRNLNTPHQVDNRQKLLDTLYKNQKQRKDIVIPRLDLTKIKQKDFDEIEFNRVNKLDSNKMMGYKNIEYNKIIQIDNFNLEITGTDDKPSEEDISMFFSDKDLEIQAQAFKMFDDLKKARQGLNEEHNGENNAAELAQQRNIDFNRLQHGYANFVSTMEQAQVVVRGILQDHAQALTQQQSAAWQIFANEDMQAIPHGTWAEYRQNALDVATFMDNIKAHNNVMEQARAQWLQTDLAVATGTGLNCFIQSVLMAYCNNTNSDGNTNLTGLRIDQIRTNIEGSGGNVLGSTGKKDSQSTTKKSSSAATELTATADNLRQIVDNVRLRIWSPEGVLLDTIVVGTGVRTLHIQYKPGHFDARIRTPKLN